MIEENWKKENPTLFDFSDYKKKIYIYNYSSYNTKANNLIVEVSSSNILL